MDYLGILKHNKGFLDLYYIEYRFPLKIPVENVILHESLLNFYYVGSLSLSNMHLILNL